LVADHRARAKILLKIIPAIILRAELRAPKQSLVAAPAASVAAPVPASATSVTASVSAATAAATTALHFGTGFVHVQSAAAHLAAVEGRDGFVSFLRIGHLYESEAARTSGVPVGHDAHAIHLTMRREQLSEFVFTRIEVQIAHEDVFHASSLGMSYLRASPSAEEQRLFGLAEKPEMANSQMRTKYSRSGI
jgi:hypothetical protein